LKFDGRDETRTFKAVDMIPKDITIVNWYWSLDRFSHLYFKEHGFKQIIGNYHPTNFFNSEAVIGDDSVVGAILACWCGSNEKLMAHNGGIQNLIQAANSLWWRSFSDIRKLETLEAATKLIPEIRSFLSGEKLPVFSEATPLSIPKGDIPLKNLVNARKDAGILLPETGLSNGAVIPVGGKLEYLTFAHFASREIPFSPTWDLRDENQFHIGDYLIAYDDGTIETVRVDYWRNIIHPSVHPLVNPSKEAGGTGSRLLYNADARYMGWDDCGNPFVLYSMTIKNPAPEKTIKEIIIKGEIVLTALFALSASVFTHR
jgi:hypothetical protein